MSIFRSIKTEIKKNLYLPFLGFSVVAFLVLFMMTDVIRGMDGKSYSIIRIIQLRKYLNFLSDRSYCWTNIWLAGMGMWVKLVAPVILSAGMIFSGSEEVQGGCDRFLKIRENRLKYATGKVLGGMLSSGFTFMLSYAVFGLAMLCFFPLPSKYDEGLRQSIEYFYGGHLSVFVLETLLGVFLLGMFMAVVPLVLMAVVKDRYILISAPFLAWYFYERIFARLFYTKFYLEHNDYIEAFNMGNLQYFSMSNKKLLTLAVLAAVCLLSFVLYYFLKFGKISEEK